MEFDELPEVFEWWGVSNWFAEKLKEHQYSASINYALAERYSEIDNKKEEQISITEKARPNINTDKKAMLRAFGENLMGRKV